MKTAAYWRLVKKASGTTKINNQACQLKKANRTLTADDTEKANLLNRFFCTAATNLIGPAGESQPIQVCSREAEPQTLTNIRIRQKEIEYKISKLKGKKAPGPDGVPV